ncbi:hypothetical protein [Flavobacterium luteum]|uniref:Lipocalin-like domain-containing protein n=1 Tax=Flavobacterium luteum TaxID=2026654 RepID=A0A7J5A7Q2_9FLAO|nr:hypothetical protein [Flavobacterium luteum]KAB1153586.1 hypothetical protein F6464_14180 [Flavobacterium luteum]
MNSKRQILKLSLLISMFSLFTACSSDDSKTQNNINYETKILGTWNLISHISSNSITETRTTIVEIGSDYNYTIEFTNNPKFINTNGNYNVNIKETNNQNQTINFNEVINSNANQQEGFHIGEWSINNGKLITRVYDIEPNEPGSYELTTEIVELTDNRLVLKTNNSASSSNNYTVTGNTTLIYER